MRNFIKEIKPFHLIGLLIVTGLIYGAFNLYSKIQFYKSFANKTRIVSVHAEQVEISTINRIYPATSVIESKQSYNVTSKTEGILNDIFFNESSFVKKGDRLFSILSTNSVGEIIITAPFDGYVGITDFKIGDKLKNGDLLLTLDDMSYMKAFIYLPEKILPQIQDTIKFSASSKLFPNQVYSGVISNLDQRVDTESRTIKAYAIIKNNKDNLRPGLLMNINIILDEIPDSLLVPEQSILTSKDYSYVFIADDDTAKLKKVSLGITNNGKTQIIDGIKPNDFVITLGHEKLKDGSKIKIIKN
jgi:multidrug efflux pump subunit AcrA (membrane-fusion protein)